MTVNYSLLRTGDLVFIRRIKALTWANLGDWLVSRAIEIVSPEFIHVGIISNDPDEDGYIEIFSAERHGVDHRPIRPDEEYVVLRVRGVHIRDLKDALLWGVRKYKGKPYGVWTAIRAGILHLMGLKSTKALEMLKMCSYICEKIILKAGVDLVEGVHSQDVTPDMLYEKSLEDKKTRILNGYI